MTTVRLFMIPPLFIIGVLFAIPSWAAASEPEIVVLPSSKHDRGKSGLTTIKAGTVATLFCKSDDTLGFIKGKKFVGNYFIVGLNCKEPGNAKICTAKSVGASEGQIVTNQLKGELGTIKGGTGTGLLLEPESGVFVTLAENACAIETSIEGGLIGEVTPINRSQSTDKFIYSSSGGKQALSKITIGGVEKTKVLKGFGLVEVVAEGSEEQEFSGATEIS